MKTSRPTGARAHGRGTSTSTSTASSRHFELADYKFLEALIKKAVRAVTAVKAIGEEAVFKHLRLISAIICPDPDRHPDIIKHCLWPLLSGPFEEMLADPIAAEMRSWLRNAYIVVPAC